MIVAREPSSVATVEMTAVALVPDGSAAVRVGTKTTAPGRGAGTRSANTDLRLTPSRWPSG